MKNLLLLLPWVLMNRRDFERIVRERNVAIELIEKLRGQLTDLDVRCRNQSREIQEERAVSESLRKRLADATDALRADVVVDS